MARLRYNGLSGTLGASLTNSATSVTFASKLTHVGGDVPTISGSDYIPLSILDANGKCAEIVWVTAYTTAGTTATISRGKEGTSGVAHDNGRVFVNGPTATRDTPRRTYYDRPSTPHADDIEFGDYADGTTTGTLSLTWANQGSATADVQFGSLVLKPDTATSNQMRLLCKSAAWGSDRTVTAIVDGMGYSTGYVGPILAVFSGTTSSPTKIALLRHYNYSFYNRYQAATFTSFGLAGGADVSSFTAQSSFAPALPQMFRLEYRSSDHRVRMFVWTGAGWQVVGSTTTFSAAPDYWAVGICLETTTQHDTIIPAVRFEAVRHNWTVGS